MTESEPKTRDFANSAVTKREHRENELKGLLGSPTGRNQLTQLLRECLKIPAGQLPVGMPIVQTILSHEFAGHEAA
jgi:hypothetical protein